MQKDGFVASAAPTGRAKEPFKGLRLLLAAGLGFAVLLVASMPAIVHGATKYSWVKSCRTVKHKKVCTWKKAYKSYSKGTPRGVTSYKPSYNANQISPSRSGTAPAGAIAVCGNGKYIYKGSPKTGCAANAGVACVLKPKMVCGPSV